MSTPCVCACVFHTYFLYISICFFVVGKVAFEQQCLSPLSSLFLLAVLLSSVAIGMIESLHDLTALPSGSFDSSYCFAMYVQELCSFQYRLVP